jgi:DNA repair protein RecO (recombination protein O)
MPLYTAEALVLRTYRLGEADRIVVFLTRDRGKKRGVAKGARRVRSRFSGGLEPLTRAAVAYFEKEHRELVGLNYVEPLRSPLSRGDAGALGHAGYFAELIDEWAQEADPNDERLYRLGAAVGEAMAAGLAVDPIARYFEYWLLRLQGVYPSLTACQFCGTRLEIGAWLPPRARGFACRACAPPAGALGLSAVALQFLRQAGRAGPAELESLSWSARAGRELEAAHQALIAGHLEKELKSFRVLRDLR